MTVVANCTSDLPSGVVRNTKPPCHAVFVQLFFAIAITLLASHTPAAAPTTQRTIRIVRTGTASQARFSATGFTTAQLKTMLALKWEREAWNKLFAVYVVSKNSDPVPAIYGDYTIESDQLHFEPAFPLKPGLTYRATFLPAVLPRAFPGQAKKVQLFSLPGPSPNPTTTVIQVYPSGNLLPENQLKFYIHFSQPMSRGEAYKNIRLLGSDGKQVPFPFLELAEELWEPQGKRFTLLFDPGRIKRGLKPREEVGPALLSGGNYTLVIDRAWRDASGKPLKNTYRKKFRVADPDDTQPNPKQWKVRAPAASTNQPLLVLFNEPLDHAMLQRVIGVVTPDGKAVAGTITVDQQESRWKFEPTTPWLPGEYQLLVSSDLEDRAGNSIGRPFEVDVFRQVQPKITRKTIQLPIRIAP